MSTWLLRVQLAELKGEFKLMAQQIEMLAQGVVGLNETVAGLSETIVGLSETIAGLRETVAGVIDRLDALETRDLPGGWDTGRDRDVLPAPVDFDQWPSGMALRIISQTRSQTTTRRGVGMWAPVLVGCG